ncbi:helicase associated domain-containing protein [Kitasatospora sp. NPDC101801]|uniref:helicase associated domain-containing protein n=1 Tax=Kitasatospora sp. NPDC101801 TaxID=3364103 RepID=UPI003810BAD6
MRRPTTQPLKTGGPSPPQPTRRPSADRFQQGVEALAAFVQEHGHPRVPRPHKQPLEAGPGGEDRVSVVSFALGTWLNNTSDSRSQLTNTRSSAALRKFVEGC